MYLGLDISLTATGVATVHKKRTPFSPHGDVLDIITTKPKDYKTMEARLTYIEYSVKEIIRECKDLEGIAIEGLSYGSKGTVKDQFAYLNITLRISCWRRGINYVVVPPKTLKKWLTNNGNASKKAMIEAVNKKWKLGIDNDNLADAYALARYAEEWFTDKK